MLVLLPMELGGETGVRSLREPKISQAVMMAASAENGSQRTFDEAEDSLLIGYWLPASPHRLRTYGVEPGLPSGAGASHRRNCDV